MRWFAGILCAVAVLGCGEDSESAEDKLQGSWVAEESGDFACAYGFKFDGGDIEAVYGCELDDSSVGFEVQRGTYEVDGDEITWTATHASCEDVDTAPETMRFEFVGDRLRLITPGGVLLMDRNKASDGTGSAEFGCYDDEGFFEPGSVRPLN
jgi:hypothetical protein